MTDNLIRNSFNLSELSLAVNESTLNELDSSVINFNLVNCFNNELLTLGYEPINATSLAELNKLFKNGLDLIERYNRQLNSLQRVKEECFKLDKENELLARRQQTLRDTNESTNRDLSNLEEKYRQLQFKFTSSTKTIKEQAEENRKLQNLIEQRDKQYKHDRKKLERENDKLKERIQALTTGKSKELPNLDLSETLMRNSTGPRATWNLDSSKKQLDLYTELIKDYDRKTKELIMENSDLRSFISNVYSDLSKSVNNNKTNETHISESNESTFQVDNDESHLDMSEQIMQLPFDNIHEKLTREFKSKLDFVNSNLTLSTINSISTANTTNDLMNTTITIEKDDTNTPGTNEFINSFKTKNTPLSTSSSSSSSSPSSISPLTDHYQQDKQDHETNQQNANLLDEIKLINDEKLKLAREKKLFYEQKLKLEKEANLCRKISADLSNTKKQFDEEQENFYQSKLFSSFVSQPKKKS